MDEETDFEKLRDAVEILQDALDMCITGKSRTAHRLLHESKRITRALRTMPKPEGEDK